MPRTTRNQSGGRPGQPAWLAILHHDVAQIIGRQLAVQYQAPQDLPADLAALVQRMDESEGTA
jgi:hypothetical protein